jgi:adenosine kinase
MAALICGSLAFDTITTFPGRFAQQILPEQVHILNVSFLVPTLRREWGGCAGNIAYSHKLLGGAPVILAALGSDGGEYLARLDALGIDTSAILVEPSEHTAQCMIITDRDNNQITAFHPGAMSLAHRATVPAQRHDLAIGIIAPDGRDAMREHAAQLHAAGIPFVFDPGQQLPQFDGAEHREMLGMARWVAVNDYEARMLSDEGCDVWQRGTATRVPGVTATEVVDPTGCGDAFRAGLLYGLERGWSLVRAAALANRLGAVKIAQRGGQNHRFAADVLEA